jgi:hypothetical protein
LSQKSHIIIPEMADVIDAIAHQSAAIDADPGCKS